MAARKPAYQIRCSGPQLKKGLTVRPRKPFIIFTLLKKQAYYLPGQFQQVGTGPAFSVVLIGAAAARQVQATPTTRTKVLKARVISISYMRVPWERKP